MFLWGQLISVCGRKGREKKGRVGRGERKGGSGEEEKRREKEEKKKEKERKEKKSKLESTARKTIHKNRFLLLKVY